MGAAIHDAAMQQHEAASPALKRPPDALDGDVGSGVFEWRASGQHLTVADAIKIAAVLLVCRHPVKHASRVPVCWLGRKLHVKHPLRAGRHASSFLRGANRR